MCFVAKRYKFFVFHRPATDEILRRTRPKPLKEAVTRGLPALPSSSSTSSRFEMQRCAALHDLNLQSHRSTRTSGASEVRGTDSPVNGSEAIRSDKKLLLDIS